MSYFLILLAAIILGGALCALCVTAYREGRQDGIRSSKSALTSATVTLKAAQSLAAQAARDWHQAEKLTGATKAMHRSNELMIVLAGNVEALTQTLTALGETVQGMGGERMNRRAAATGENPVSARAPKPAIEIPMQGSWGTRE